MVTAQTRVPLGWVLFAALSAACASSKGVRPQPFPQPAESSPRRPEIPPPPASLSSTIVVTAMNLRGVPYRNGGSDPSGFDCSGFTQFVFAQVGLALPREVRDQYQIGDAIKRSDARAGDLVFFTTTSRGASHVGILIDEDRFVHAPSSTGVVRVEHVSSQYWRTRLVGTRRIVDRD